MIGQACVSRILLNDDLVRFKGELNEGITLRDAVNAIPYWAIKQGHLTVPKKNKVNIFNGRILEMEGLPDLSVEQAFELTDAAAERSAAAGCIKLSEESVCTYLRSNVALMKKLIEEGYQDPETLQGRIDAVNEWLKDPKLLRADADAEYAAVIEIDLAEITEPILACPNDPDDVKPLSDIQGTPIQDIFLGSCMTNIGHFRTAAEIWRGEKFNPNVRTWVCPPTRMAQAKLKEEAVFSVFSAMGARLEIAGCSLCMVIGFRLPPPQLRQSLNHLLLLPWHFFSGVLPHLSSRKNLRRQLQKFPNRKMIKITSLEEVLHEGAAKPCCRCSVRWLVLS
jgi:aconitate hydratase 2/2-methylisocitrate dehydratase